MSRVQRSIRQRAHAVFNALGGCAAARDRPRCASIRGTRGMPTRIITQPETNSSSTAMRNLRSSIRRVRRDSRWRPTPAVLRGPKTTKQRLPTSSGRMMSVSQWGVLSDSGAGRLAKRPPRRQHGRRFVPSCRKRSDSNGTAPPGQHVFWALAAVSDAGAQMLARVSQ
jgi:hypothetical protein